MAISIKLPVLLGATFIFALTGCGGSSDNAIVEDAGSYPPVPASVEYRQEGKIIGLQRFDYSNPAVISSRFYIEEGEDATWGTVDDMAGGGLDCHYEKSVSPIAPARLSVVKSMANSAEGSTALANLDIAPDGRLSVCPPRTGWQLVREEVRCEGSSFCPARYQFGYLMELEQQTMDDGWLQKQHVIFYGPNDNLTTAPPLPSHIQHTRLTGEAESGFQFLVNVEPSPEYGNDSMMAEHFIYVAPGYHKKMVQWLPDSLESRVVEDHYDGSDMHVNTHYRTVTALPEKGQVQDSESSRNPPPAGEPMKVYGFDQKERPVSDITQFAGQDETWFTDDDEIYGYPEFVYDEQGRLIEVLDYSSEVTMLYQYRNEKSQPQSVEKEGIKVREFFYDNEQPSTITLAEDDIDEGEKTAKVTYRYDIPDVGFFVPDQRWPRSEGQELLDPVFPKTRKQLMQLPRPF